MKNQLVFTLISMSVLILSGCASKPLVEDSSVENNTIEKISSRKGKVGGVKLVPQGEKTLVLGSIRRTTSSRILNGHVHIEFRNGKNAIVDKTTVDYRIPKRGKRVAKSARFRAELNTRLTEDITLKIEHHDYDDEKESSGSLKLL